MKAMSSMTRQAVAVGGQGAKADLLLRCAGQDGAASNGMLAGGRGGRDGPALNLALMGLAVSLDPPLTASIAALRSKRGVRQGPAFVTGGWCPWPT
jgi:hypothetical protein